MMPAHLGGQGCYRRRHEDLTEQASGPRLPAHQLGGLARRRTSADPPRYRDRSARRRISAATPRRPAGNGKGLGRILVQTLTAHSFASLAH